MTTLEFSIHDYLDEDEIKEIAISEVRKSVRDHLSDKGDIATILSNSAFKVVWDAVDEVFDGDVHTVLKEQVIGRIRKLTAFDIFHKPDAWSRETNSAYQILERITLSKKDMMENRIDAMIASLDVDYMKDLFEENFTEIILDKLKGGEKQ